MAENGPSQTSVSLKQVELPVAMRHENKELGLDVEASSNAAFLDRRLFESALSRLPSYQEARIATICTQTWRKLSRSSIGSNGS